MFFSQFLTTQRLVLILDEIGKEKFANQIICQLLREQQATQNELTTKTLSMTKALADEATLDAFLNECNHLTDQKCNALLPPLSEFLVYQRPSIIIEFLQKLKKCEQVKRIYIWVSSRNVMHPHAGYLVAAFVHMADVVLQLQAKHEAKILIRKPGGGVTNKQYQISQSGDALCFELIKQTAKVHEEANMPKAEPISSFKIELEEDELVARNAMKLPYEKSSESSESNIIYTPDAEDDFDDEDPDEDLCI